METCNFNPDTKKTALPPLGAQFNFTYLDRICYTVPIKNHFQLIKPVKIPLIVSIKMVKKIRRQTHSCRPSVSYWFYAHDRSQIIPTSIVPCRLLSIVLVH